MRTLIYISFAAAFAAQTACATGLPTNGLQAHFRADHADMIKTSTGLPQHGSSVTNWIAEMGVATPFSLVQHESYDCPRLQTNAFVRADGTLCPALRFRRNTDNTADVGTTNRLLSSVRTSLNMDTASTWFLVMNNLTENKQVAAFGFIGGDEYVYTFNRFGAFFVGDGHLRLHNNSNPGSNGNITLPVGSSCLIDSRGDGSRMTSGLNGSEVINIAEKSYSRPADQSLYLGRFFKVDDSAAFDCAELAIYNRALNDAETTIIRNSLAARWGLVLASPLWTGASVGFCEDLAGIGSSTATGDGRIPGVVETSASTGGLTVSVPEGSLAGVDGYLLVAHDGKAAKPIASDGNTRLARTWRMESTFVSTPALSFSFDLLALGFTAGDFSGRLFYRANAASAFADTGLSGVLSDGAYSFTFSSGTDIGGEYMLVVDGATIRPCAGVADSLAGWYRADTGVTVENGAVSVWRNLGLLGAAADVTKSAGTGSATLSRGAFSEGGVNFDGTALLKTVSDVAFAPFNDNAWFVVFKVADGVTPTNMGVAGNRDEAIRFGAFFTGASDLRTHGFVQWNNSAKFCVVPNANMTMGNAMLVDSVRTGNAVDARLDGSRQDGKMTALDNANASAFMIGQMAGLANKFNGDIAEVRVYNRALPDAGRNIVANHLAARYGVTMTGSSLYGGAANDCVLDVVGVGCTTNAVSSASGVHVAGTIAVSDNSAGLTIAADGALSDGDYVLAGHGEKDNGWVRVDRGMKRMKRAWHITKTNASSVDVELRFDIPTSGIAPLDSAEKPGYVLMRSVGGGAWEIVDASVVKVGGNVFYTEIPAVKYAEGLYTLGARVTDKGFVVIIR